MSNSYKLSVEVVAAMEREEVQANDLFFFRDDVKVEPLVCRWYAWPHAVSPIQMAFNMAFRYIPMLESFIASPSVHEAAARNPDLFCGPFLPLGPESVSRVREFLSNLRARCGELIKLALEIKELEQQLTQTSGGLDLDPFYAKLSPRLSGLVELVYDLGGKPRVRLLEEVVTATDLSTVDEQEIAIAVVDESKRGFFLNTPRLDAPDWQIVSMPFADERLDQLASLRYRPAKLDAIARVLDLSPEATAAFRRFLTNEPPRRRAPNYSGSGIRVRYFGHACVLLESAEVSVLIDPVVAWERAADDGDARFTFADLPDFVDYVVITHGHQDHFSLEVLLQLRARIGTVVVPRNNSGNLADPSLKLLLEELAFPRVCAMDPFDSIATERLRIVSLPFFGEHAGLDIYSKQCVYVELLGHTFAFWADSNCADQGFLRRLAERIGRVDTLFIGMECRGAPLTWLYGPYLNQPINRRNDESRRLSGSDAPRAAMVAEALQCSRCYVYAMGMEPWMRRLTGLACAPGCVQLTEAATFVEKCSVEGRIAKLLNGAMEFHLEQRPA